MWSDVAVAPPNEKVNFCWRTVRAVADNQLQIPPRKWPPPLSLPPWRREMSTRTSVASLPPHGRALLPPTTRSSIPRPEPLSMASSPRPARECWTLTSSVRTPRPLPLLASLTPRARQAFDPQRGGHHLPLWRPIRFQDVLGHLGNPPARLPGGRQGLRETPRRRHGEC